MDISLNPGTWLLAFLPIAALMCGILILKWEASKVGAIMWLAALGIAFFFFGADTKLLLLASSKGLSLSLYVLLIIWSAVFLYNTAEKAGAINVIGTTMTRITDDKQIQCLLFAWCFIGVLQGLAGFGVPVAIVAPIMVVMGFSPMTAVTACLVGHSWAISFGSMGSSYNTIQLVTGIPGDVIGPWMAIVFSVGIFSTGFAVAHLCGGWAGVKKSAGPVLTAGAAMALAMWGATVLGIAQLASLLAGMSGCIVMLCWAALKKHSKADARASDEKPAMSFNAACSPYYALILISVVLQITPIKAALARFSWGLSYPAVQTGLGYTVEAASKYSKISFFSHPAPILLVSALIGIFVYLRLGNAKKEIVPAAAKSTAARCVPMSVAIMTMVMMALVMSDSGMMNLISQGVAKAFGGFYPLAAPFIGTLGSFITGSNTNSNIMFGLLQTQTAQIIGKSAVLMAAAQSVGGSLGIAVAPSTIMIGCANVGLSGEENRVMGRTLRYCAISAALVGVFVYILDLLITV